MDQQTAVPLTKPSQKKLESYVEEKIDVSPPNAVQITETHFHLKPREESSSVLDFGDMDNNISFVEWLQGLPEEVQRDITQTFSRIDEMSPDTIAEMLSDLQLDKVQVDNIIPVEQGSHPFQNADRKGQKVRCARRGCYELFLVEDPEQIFCPQCHQ